MNNIKHVAIIMDGNGRWAQSRLRPRIWGHVRGASIVSNIVEEADDLGLEALTLYAFSTENWSRPQAEVSALFTLLKKFLIAERQRIITNKIRFKVIGDLSGLPAETKKLVSDLEEDTIDHQGLKLSFAFGYSGRKEIIGAMNNFIEDNPGQKICEESFVKYLYSPELDEVDLLIRTGGDQRISNFLLWQIAYAELYFTETPWPNFSREEFRNIIADVSGRERRFGNISASGSFKSNFKKATSNMNMMLGRQAH